MTTPQVPLQWDGFSPQHKAQVAGTTATRAPLAWFETAGFDHTGYALHELERRIAGQPYETAGGQVRVNRYTQEITASVWVYPGLQGGMRETKPWERHKTFSTLMEAQRWVEHTLEGTLRDRPTPWTLA